MKRSTNMIAIRLTSDLVDRLTDSLAECDNDLNPVVQDAEEIFYLGTVCVISFLDRII